MKRLFAYVLACCAICAGVFAASRHFPLTISGITAGKSFDKDVVRKFGKGYFVDDEDHLGGRYFVDSAHKVTFHVTIGVDRLVFTVELIKGIHLPKGAQKTALTKATSARLSSSPTLERGIHIGSTPTEVIQAYGKPDSNAIKSGIRTLKYVATEKEVKDVMSCEAEFRFRDGRLVFASIYNGE